jgi:hypothetical protein
MHSQHKKHLLVSVGVMAFGTLACEPVIAIGWKELFFVFVLMSFVFGPPIYRFIRRIEKFRDRQRKNNTK